MLRIPQGRTQEFENGGSSKHQSTETCRAAGSRRIGISLEKSKFFSKRESGGPEV